MTLDKRIESFPDVDDRLGINEETPIPFPADEFPELIEQIAAE